MIRYAVALLVAGVLFAGVGWKGYVSGKAHVQAAWDKDKAERTTAALAAEKQARDREVELQAGAAKQRGIANAKIHSLDLERDELLKRLRSRPARPASGDVPTAAGAGGGGCTGANLYRSDAAAFVRLASDADRLSIALQSCTSAYNAARAVK